MSLNTLLLFSLLRIRPLHSASSHPPPSFRDRAPQRVITRFVFWYINFEQVVDAVRYKFCMILQTLDKSSATNSLENALQYTCTQPQCLEFGKPHDVMTLMLDSMNDASDGGGGGTSDALFGGGLGSTSSSATFRCKSFWFDPKTRSQIRACNEPLVQSVRKGGEKMCSHLLCAFVESRFSVGVVVVTLL